METRQEKLVGRWFNSQNSLNFYADGTLFWNAAQGQTDGRYFYDGGVRSTGAAKPIQNLTMDVVQNGRSTRTVYELQFLGGERIRMLRVDLDRNQARRRMLVLKRAEPGTETEAVQPIIPIAPARTRTTASR